MTKVTNNGVKRISLLFIQSTIKMPAHFFWFISGSECPELTQQTNTLYVESIAGDSLNIGEPVFLFYLYRLILNGDRHSKPRMFVDNRRIGLDV
jgi:hypothetical protein